MTTNKLITVSRAEEILQVTKSTIYKYVREGKIPAYKIYNGKVLFKVEELLEFLESCKVKPMERIKLPKEAKAVTPTNTQAVLNRLKEL